MLGRPNLGRIPMKLGLGTIEFAEKTGKHAAQVPWEEAKAMLRLAADAGITLLDSAADAGNSEAVLGTCLPESHSFRIVSRAPYCQSDFMVAHYGEQLEQSVRQTLARLRQERLYALMTSMENGLRAPQGERLLKRMAHLKTAGLIEKVGVSLSHPEEVSWLLERFTPDIVQIPLNVLDQRFWASGALKALNKKGIEVHARNVFLQGVLLDPLHLHPWFWGIRKSMEQYHNFLIHEGLTPLEGALNFVTSLPEVDYALIGAHATGQLSEMTRALVSGVAPDDFVPFGCRDPKFIDPLQWNLYE